MLMTLAYAAGAIALVSVISFVGLFTLAFRERVVRGFVFVLVGLAAGALFGDALIHLIPEALESDLGKTAVGSTIMLGIVAFFTLEKFLLWHHSHGVHEESGESIASHDHQPKTIGSLVLAADFIHNAVDGVIIGASFLVSNEVGIATTIAVVLHEIPQEIADFGLLIHSGWTRRKALLWNFFSALSAFAGLFVVWYLDGVENIVPLAAAFTAGAFLYIAGSDLVPELQRTSGLNRTAMQIASVMFGFGLMLLLVIFE